MTRIPEPPCDHYDRFVGTIGAGDIKDRSQPLCSVATCYDCIAKSAGYVQMRTGLPADPFLSYEEARGQESLWVTERPVCRDCKLPLPDDYCWVGKLFDCWSSCPPQYIDQRAVLAELGDLRDRVRMLEQRADDADERTFE